MYIDYFRRKPYLVARFMIPISHIVSTERLSPILIMSNDLKGNCSLLQKSFFLLPFEPSALHKVCHSIFFLAWSILMRISHELSILIMYAVNYLVKTVHKKRKTFRITNKRQISWWMRRRHDIHTHCAPVDWIKVDRTYMLTVQCALVMKLGSGIFQRKELLPK